jgi:hypothetical protein
MLDRGHTSVRETVISRTKQTLTRISLRLIRAYYRYVPLPFGKLFVWNTIVRPYLLWRPFESDATTRFGARIHVKFPDTIQTYIYFYFFGVWEPVISPYIHRHRYRRQCWI